MRPFLITAFLLGLPVVAQSQMHRVSIQLGSPPKVAKSVKDLVVVSEAVEAGKWNTCSQLAQKALKRHPEVKGWIYTTALKCHYQSAQSTKKVFPAVAALVAQIWKDKQSLLTFDPSAKALRTPLIDLTFLLIEQNVQSRKAQSWKWFDELLAVREWLDSSARARLYRLAGDNSLYEQNLSLAKEYYERSLIEKSNAKVLARLEAVSRQISKKEEVTPPTPSPTPEASPEEIQVFDRMEAAIRSKDYLAALEDGMKLIKEFSGGKKAAQATKNVLSIYLTLASRTEEKYQNLKDEVLERMQKADGQRLYDWALTMAGREHFADVVALTEKSIDQLAGHLAAKVILLTAQAAQHIGEGKKARSFYGKLIREHAGTRVSAEALYRLGLMDYRDKQYAESIARFDQFLATEHSEDFDLSSLYWSWRAAQKVTPDKANAAAERLVAKYPISYYGLRARAEMAQGAFKIEKDLKNPVSYTLNLTPHENQTWQRFLLLQKAGWFPEAQAELLTLPEPISAEGQVVFAYLWSEIRDFLKSAEFLYKSYQQNPELITLSTLRFVYPLEHLPLIQKEASRYQIPKELILGLIKQESSFDTNAKSPAGALGLMQLMTATARELASDLRIKSADISKDLKKPSLNIRLGSQYLHRRLKTFEGNVPLALAAYNAGIGNVRSWLRVRHDLKDFYKKDPTSFEEEMWFDELPWSETSGYIKSVLRNYLVYHLLDQGEVTVTDPVWKLAQKNP